MAGSRIGLHGIGLLLALMFALMAVTPPQCTKGLLTFDLPMVKSFSITQCQTYCKGTALRFNSTRRFLGASITAPTILEPLQLLVDESGLLRMRQSGVCHSVDGPSIWAPAANHRRLQSAFVPAEARRLACQGQPCHTCQEACHECNQVLLYGHDAELVRRPWTPCDIQGACQAPADKMTAPLHCVEVAQMTPGCILDHIRAYL